MRLFIITRKFTSAETHDIIGDGHLAVFGPTISSTWWVCENPGCAALSSTPEKSSDGRRLTKTSTEETLISEMSAE
jgi:hypothetical protein